MQYKMNGNVIMDNIVVTHKRMNLLIDQYINTLRREGIHSNQLIVIKMPRSPELIGIMFAALQEKISFCILDVNTPEARQQEAFSVASLLFEESEKGEVIWTRLETKKSYDFSEVAYLLYTSGTMGKPKGVMVTYKGLENFLKGIPRSVPIQKGKAIVSFTSSTFDIFMLESVLALYLGKDVVLASREQSQNPRKMAALLRESNADMLQITPSGMKMLQSVDRALQCLGRMKLIMVGGEAFPQSLLLRLQANTDARIFNMYGPTETTIWSMVAELTGTSDVTVGLPIRHTKVYILSQEGAILGVGETGEICIGGDGLAMGYLLDEENTLEKFTFLKDGKEKVYHTGDLGVVAKNGELVCLGRMDEQIKLNGHRIELSDIDMNLMVVQGIQNSITCFDQDSNRLIAFYTTEDRNMDERHIRNVLSERLPGYMLPNQFVQVEGLQYTSSGKVDRNRMLCNYHNEKSSKKDVKEHCGDIQGKILHIIAMQCDVEEEELLQQKHRTMDELGIDSIRFISLVLELENCFGFEFDDEKLDIHGFTNVGELMEYVERTIG